MRRRVHGFQGVLSGLAHPASTVRGVRRAWPAAREMFAEGRAPRTSLNRPIGQGRTLAVVRSRLDVVKGVAHTHGAAVNLSGKLFLLSRHGVPVLEAAHTFFLENAPKVSTILDNVSTSTGTMA